ncbi:hypothetical protein CJF30_00010354 [Rutstroemia sp. NJR-2017a BBW]|nr:hypothetical protein CJF30_00010354 [Rutstroemia sp. NJR-2017a BBW]
MTTPNCLLRTRRKSSKPPLAFAVALRSTALIMSTLRV